jgi:hypothetical protein
MRYHGVTRPHIANDLLGLTIATSVVIVRWIATFRWHHATMIRPSMKLECALLALACVLLASCAGRTAGEGLADLPHWMGGLPAGVPPRTGTPEYDAWMAARAEEAARPKNDPAKSDSTKTDQPKAVQTRKNGQAN